MAILVTGGAGYIGSHVVKALSQAGHEVVVFDNLSTGHAKAVGKAKLIHGDLADQAKVKEVFATHRFDAVLHFAASIVVPESVREPLRYYQNNTLNALLLIQHCVSHGVKSFIFSSTAAVYGMPSDGICREEGPKAPINPYGSSKLMSETILQDACAVSDMKSVILRYFNVAGADPDGDVGQSFPDATHLIKVACQVATGKRPGLKVFGTDYATADGTCIRDYIHVSDLAQAHVSALNYLREGGSNQILNCGYGHGYSVNEVVERVKKVSGVDFAVEYGPRREGDPASLTASNKKILSTLKWTPKHDDLDFIIKTALNWEKNARY